MKQKIVDIAPGQVFEKILGLAGRGRQLFLKLNDQKVVNLTGNVLCAYSDEDMQEEVTVFRHPLGSYLAVGGIDEEG